MTALKFMWSWKQSRYVQVTLKLCFTVGPHPTIWYILSDGLDSSVTCNSGDTADSADTCGLRKKKIKAVLNIIISVNTTTDNTSITAFPFLILQIIYFHYFFNQHIF